MKSVTTNKFRRLLENLPKDIQNKAKRTYLIWKNNPYHPGIKFKKIHELEAIYSIRIGMSHIMFI